VPLAQESAGETNSAATQAISDHPGGLDSMSARNASRTPLAPQPRAAPRHSCLVGGCALLAEPGPVWPLQWVGSANRAEWGWLCRGFS
jgi:hypothetical protein